LSFLIRGASQGRIIIEALRPATYDLAALVAGITDEIVMRLSRWVACAPRRL
jgi:hypothetical protein